MIISDPNIAKDLLVTNGNVFSSRKEMYFKSQTVFAGRGITATPYNDRWYVFPASPLPLLKCLCGTSGVSTVELHQHG